MSEPTREGSDAASVTDAPNPELHRSSVGRASVILASGTLISRLLGFVSQVVLASTIGVNTDPGNSFALANQLPNNVYALVAGGLLSAVLVPQIVKAALHSDGGARFINRLITLGIVVFVGVTIIATLCAPLLVPLYVKSGFDAEQLALATALAYWCLPQILFYALYSLIGETLNARGLFGPFAWAPVLNNVVMIGGLIVFQNVFGGAEQNRDAASWSTSHVALLAGSATLGIAVQAFALFFFLGRAGIRFRPDFHWRGVGLGATGRSAFWVFAMFLVTQVSGVVEAQVASTASDGDASLNALRIGWLMFMLPHSIATVSIMTAYFTRMSAHVRDVRMPELRADISAALKTILMIMVFSTIGLAVLSMPFSAVFAQVTYAETASLGAIYVAFLGGLIPFTIFFVLLRIFYALDRTRDAFVIQVAQTAFFVVGALIIGRVVPQPWIAVVLAGMLSTAVALQAVLSALVLRRPLGGLGTWPVFRQSLWFVGAAVPAGAVGWGILQLLGGIGSGAFPVATRLGALSSMAIAGIGMTVVYVAILWFTRNPELRSFVTPVLARLGRGR